MHWCGSALRIQLDLDLCAHIYGEGADKRNAFAQFAPLVHEAAKAGDAQAAEIFRRGADELVECVLATRRALAVPDQSRCRYRRAVACFSGASLMLDAFRDALAAARPPLEYRAPQVFPRRRRRAVCRPPRRGAVRSPTHRR